ncbi:MarR family winged helix-turn-helix transcriptional regulator [Kineosporia sp. NBRC 101731]|uniref:MarR family winged helix-turn-helix transcriptional regulator n=1 Tax=Kineosporia sp. NBRC 101731 TaxID=3032199 RepID=UPI0024A56663|nr:MarR family winged helix-turn-helix transcriptional regulator [Kineosporia sp. NBRC 101731]GLY33379.1 MarR family transcriptional regulator [Kineosporia sp. NBRC 101731]
MSSRGYLELGEELRTVVGELVRRARATDELPANHAAALGHLDRSGPATIAELAHACHIRHQSMTAIVHQIAERGEATAEPHPTDRRAVLYRLTAVGRTELERDRHLRARWLAQCIEDEFGDDTQGIEDALQVLRRLRDRT